MVAEFFAELKQHIMLSKQDSATLINDFENALGYYTSLRVLQWIACCGSFVFYRPGTAEAQYAPDVAFNYLRFFAAIIGLIVLHDRSRWPLIVVGVVSFAILTVCVVLFGGQIVAELKKLFHTK